MQSSRERTAQIFDQLASNSSWEKLYSGTVNRLTYNFVSRHRAAKEMLEPHAKGEVLDIGCGTGDLVPFYMTKGVSYTGIDLSEKIIERARAINASFVQEGKAFFRVLDCESLPFGNGEFDVLSAVAVLEYLPDSSKALNEIRRVVRTGGYALITVPNRHCVNFWIRDFLKPLRWVLYPIYARLKGPSLAALKDVKHYGYTEEELDGLMKNRGFRKVSGRYTNYYIIPHPLDHLAPSLYVRISEWIDRGQRDKRFRYWGANYLALYKKIESL